jgi:hypothetical protein
MRKHTLEIIFSVIVLIICLRIFLPQVVFRNAFLFKHAGSLFEYLSFQPGDLYDLNMGSSVDLSKADYKSSSTFSCKYFGTYNLGVIFEKFPRNSWKDRIKHSGLKLEITISTSRGTNVRYFEQDKIGLWAEGVGTWSMLSIDCPKDVLLDQAVTCVYKTINPDANLGLLYGPTNGYMQRTVGF